MLGDLDGVTRRCVERLRGLITRFWEARYGGVLLREFVLLAVMLWLYKYVRFLAKHETADAFQNADRVLHLERALGLEFETPLQQLLLPYKCGHPGLQPVLRDRPLHRHGRVPGLGVRAFARSSTARSAPCSSLVTLGALAIHVLFPLAPPRMMPGFVDTMVLYGPNPYNSQAVQSLRQPVRGDAVAARRLERSSSRTA